jgi:predicted lipoprotein with Yx(FWY)xxD motif
MRSRTIVGLTFAATTLLSACGGYSSHSQHTATSTAKNPASTTTTVKVSRSELGDVLVDANGHTLYGFTNDAHGTSTCAGTCAQNWPPLKATSARQSGPGVNSAIFHATTRDDGQPQLAAGKWPLYRFAGDSRPGDINGQGSLGKWFAIRPDGTLVKDGFAATPSTTTPAASGYGY